MNRANVGLAAGAAVGIGLAAAGLLAPGVAVQSRLPEGAAASVNGAIIGFEEYERALAAVAADRRESITEHDRRRVLDRLVDEELLIQRGLELGLARHDSKVRADLTSAVIASIVGESNDVQPSERELESFYRENRDFFRRPGRLRIREMFFSTRGSEENALGRAREAVARLRGGVSFEAVRDALGDPPLAVLPDRALPPEKWIDYLGPKLVHALLALDSGAFSEPLPSGSGVHVLQLLERSPDSIPTLAEARAEVLAEYRRRAGESALERYLENLRRRASIEVASP